MRASMQQDVINFFFVKAVYGLGYLDKHFHFCIVRERCDRCGSKQPPARSVRHLEKRSHENAHFMRTYLQYSVEYVTMNIIWEYEMCCCSHGQVIKNKSYRTHYIHILHIYSLQNLIYKFRIKEGRYFFFFFFHFSPDCCNPSIVCCLVAHLRKQCFDGIYLFGSFKKICSAVLCSMHSVNAF